MENLDDIYVFLLVRTAQQFKKQAQRILNEAGIDLTSEQWVVLKRVHENEGINQKEIAELTYRDPASVTRTLDLLEKRKLLYREVSPNSRRSFSLYLTDQGTKLVGAVAPVALKNQENGLNGISDEELTAFKSTINKMYANFLK